MNIQNLLLCQRIFMVLRVDYIESFYPYSLGFDSGRENKNLNVPNHKNTATESSNGTVSPGTALVQHQEFFNDIIVNYI